MIVVSQFRHVETIIMESLFANHIFREKPTQRVGHPAVEKLMDNR